ncbi:MAG: DUF4375 domain-containing protein [Kofleriaceae bacterium]|nr:DUF4375 domain-containing protein [Kofleriaceae bacterium]
MRRHAPSRPARFGVALALITCACGRPRPLGVVAEAATTEAALPPASPPTMIDANSLRADRPAALTLDAIARTPDDALTELIHYALLEQMGPNLEGERRLLATARPGLRAFWVAYTVELEVANGGFNQYYWNSAGAHAAEAPAAFEYFGATKHAAIMRKANQVRAEEEDVMKTYQNQGALEAFSASHEQTHLGPLDEAFWAVPEEMLPLYIARVRRTPAEFTRWRSAFSRS